MTIDLLYLLPFPKYRIFILSMNLIGFYVSTSLTMLSLRSVSPLPYNLRLLCLFHTLVMEDTCQPGLCRLTFT